MKLAIRVRISKAIIGFAGAHCEFQVRTLLRPSGSASSPRGFAYVGPAQGRTSGRVAWVARAEPRFARPCRTRGDDPVYTFTDQSRVGRSGTCCHSISSTPAVSVHASLLLGFAGGRVGGMRPPSGRRSGPAGRRVAMSGRSQVMAITSSGRGRLVTLRWRWRVVVMRPVQGHREAVSRGASTS